MRLCDATSVGATLPVTNNQIQRLRIEATNFVASHATKIVLFALAQNRPGQHMSTCLSGILSQDFQARLVRQPGFFLARFLFIRAVRQVFEDPTPASLICIVKGRFLLALPVTRIEDG
mgnify:CR=1 FL=1